MTTESQTPAPDAAEPKTEAPQTAAPTATETTEPAAAPAATETSEPAEGTPIIRPSTTEHPLYDAVADACRTVFDPEIPVNIYDLGLVYTIEITDDNVVNIVMTLTAPGCPVAGDMPEWVQNAIESVPGVREVNIMMTFDPQWGMDMMSEEARLELGFM